MKMQVEAGLAFVRRIGNEQAGQWLDSYQWLAGVLRGGSAVAAEAIPIHGYAGNPLALFHAHLTRAIVAAIFGDQAVLARHTAEAMPLPSWASTRAPWPTRCAEWPWLRMPVQRIPTSAAVCSPSWMV